MDGAEDNEMNILLLYSDDHGWPYAGYMQPCLASYMQGAGVTLTPHMDALAAGGGLFEHSHACAAVCEQSIDSLMTGLHQHDIRTSDIVNSYSLWSTALNAHAPDWRTFHRGKWWRGSIETAFTDHGGGMDWEFARDANGIQPLLAFMSDCQAHARQFVAFAAMPLPHSPYTPPAQYKALYDGISAQAVASLPFGALRNSKLEAQRYLGMVSWFDARVGEAVAFLDQTGLRTTTVVIVLTDNGNLLDQSKYNHRDDGMRTPIIINGPTIPSGWRSRALVSQADMYPTILDFAELPLPANAPTFDTMSFRSLCENGGHGQWREYACETYKSLLCIEQEINGDLYRVYAPTLSASPNQVWNIGIDPQEHYTHIGATAEGVAVKMMLWPKARTWYDQRVPAPLIAVQPR
jgi:arylsulfatase A-like enzyme